MAESGVRDTIRTSNEERSDVQITNKSHDHYNHDILRLSRYYFESLGTTRANYHCCILYRGAQHVAVSNREKAARVMGHQQLAAAPRQCASTFGNHDSTVFGETIVPILLI